MAQSVVGSTEEANPGWGGPQFSRRGNNQFVRTQASEHVGKGDPPPPDDPLHLGIVNDKCDEGQILHESVDGWTGPIPCQFSAQLDLFMFVPQNDV